MKGLKRERERERERIGFIRMFILLRLIYDY
jgi:hypothetical protein